MDAENYRRKKTISCDALYRNFSPRKHKRQEKRSKTPRLLWGKRGVVFLQIVFVSLGNGFTVLRSRLRGLPAKH